jgi:hypothetical protein
VLLFLLSSLRKATPWARRVAKALRSCLRAGACANMEIYTDTSKYIRCPGTTRMLLAVAVVCN